MMTYTEKWGDLWKMFITDSFFLKDDRAIKISKKKMIDLAEDFEIFLSELADDLQIA